MDRFIHLRLPLGAYQMATFTPLDNESYEQFGDHPLRIDIESPMGGKPFVNRACTLILSDAYQRDFELALEAHRDPDSEAARRLREICARSEYAQIV